MRDADGYRLVADPDYLNENVIARLYGIPAESIQMFRLPELNVVKISYPRPVSQGSLARSRHPRRTASRAAGAAGSTPSAHPIGLVN